MKRLLPLIPALFFVLSCGKRREEVKEAEVVSVNLDLAKATLEEMLVYKEKFEQKEISEDEFEAFSSPLITKLNSLRSQLNEKEKVEFNNYHNDRLHRKYPFSVD